MSSIQSPAASQSPSTTNQTLPGNTTSGAPTALSGTGKGANQQAGTAAGGSQVNQTAGTSFNQTLIQMVTDKLVAGFSSDPNQVQGQTANNQTSSLVELLLGATKGSLPGAIAKGDDTGIKASSEAATQALDGLSKLLDSNSDLDQTLLSNPDLVAQLQNWIQQAMVLLHNPASENVQNQVPDGANPQIRVTLPVLAMQPGTLRFAVQDMLQLLKEQLGSPNAQGKIGVEDFAKLIQTLQTTLQQESPSQSAPVMMQGPVLTQQPVLMQQPAQVQQQQSFSTTHDVSVESLLTSTSAKQEDSSTDSQHSSSNDGNNGSLNFGNVMTAGQLQMRDTAGAPVQASNPVPVEKFAQEMTGFVVNKLDIVKLQGISEATISLTPEHLGQVDVKISLHNGQVVAQFVTEHAFAKQSLEQQMMQLRSALESQGLQVDKLEVTQNTGLSSHMYHDGKQPGTGSQQRQNSKQKDTTADDALTSVDTLEEWNEWVRDVQQQQQNYGSSFVAKA